MSPPRRFALTLLLVVPIVVAYAVRRFWPAEPAARTAPAPPPTASDDDFGWLASIDAAPREEPARDLVAVGAGEVFVVRARDEAVLAVAEKGGRERVLGRLQAVARAMAVCGDALWIATGPAFDASSDAGPLADASSDAGPLIDAASEGGAIASVESRRLLRMGVRSGAIAAVAKLSEPRDVACDARWVFVVDEAASGALDHAGTIRRFGIDGAEAAPAGKSDAAIANVALGDADVFWADRLDGTIVAAPKEGGPARVLARERGLPGEVFVDRGSITWAEARSESLWTMPLAGGSPSLVVQDFAGFARFVVAEGAVWWVSEGAAFGGYRVLTVPVTGGEAAPASPNVAEIDAIATDGARVYWAFDGKATPATRMAQTR